MPQSHPHSSSCFSSCCALNCWCSLFSNLERIGAAGPHPSWIRRLRWANCRQYHHHPLLGVRERMGISPLSSLCASPAFPLPTAASTRPRWPQPHRRSRPGVPAQRAGTATSAPSCANRSSAFGGSTGDSQPRALAAFRAEAARRCSYAVSRRILASAASRSAGPSPARAPLPTHCSSASRPQPFPPVPASVASSQTSPRGGRRRGIVSARRGLTAQFGASRRAVASGRTPPRCSLSAASPRPPWAAGRRRRRPLVASFGPSHGGARRSSRPCARPGRARSPCLFLREGYWASRRLMTPSSRRSTQRWMAMISASTESRDVIDK
eukprot:PhM_4_TR14560/c0_g1_i1/m.45646